MTDAPASAPETWRKCSSCKKSIGFKQLYWVCNVSTCNRLRTGLVFCSVSCWDAHVPMMNHRESWALEKKSPSVEEAARGEDPGAAKPLRATEKETPAPARAAPTTTTVLRRNSDGTTEARSVPIAPSVNTNRAVVPPVSSTSRPVASGEKEILVVVSKLKAYIRVHSEMNTSESVMVLLSDRVRGLCDDAIAVAKKNDRKTVLDRDFRCPTPI